MLVVPNNLGIASISCHSRYVSIDALLWNTGDCIDILYYVNASIEQYNTDRYKRGMYTARREKKLIFFFLY